MPSVGADFDTACLLGLKEPDHANTPTSINLYSNVEISGEWTKFTLWNGTWSGLMQADGKTPKTWSTNAKDTINMMVPIRASGRAYKGAPFNVCLQDVCTQPNVPPTSLGYNQNIGNAYMLPFVYQVSQALKTARTIKSPDGKRSYSVLDFMYGVTDPYAGWLAPAGPQRVHYNKKTDPCIAQQMSMVTYPTKVPPSISVAKLWPNRVSEAFRKAFNVTTLAAPLPTKAGDAACPIDPKKWPQVGSPGTTYNCGTTTVTPTQQYPFCLQGCGGPPAAADGNMHVSGTCAKPASNICGCACTQGCACCSIFQGYPGMARGLELAAPLLQSVADVAKMDAELAGGMLGSAKNIARYAGGKHGGFSLGKPQLTPGPMGEWGEGGIVDSSWGDEGALRDDFWDGIKASNWGILTAKGGKALGAAVLPTTCGSGGEKMPLMEMVVDDVMTYDQETRFGQATPLRKPVCCMRAYRQMTKPASGSNPALNFPTIDGAANLTTSKWYGSGLYEFVVKFPRVRGGVNAIWTFHGVSSSNYSASTTNGAGDGKAPAGGGAWNVPLGAKYTDASKPQMNTMGAAFYPDSQGDLTLAPNHEIDIEIPTNGPPVGCAASGFFNYKKGTAGYPSAAAPMGWNTVNLNSYCATSGGGSGHIPYVNVPIVSDEPVVDGERYNVYAFQWIAGHAGSNKADPLNPDTWQRKPHINFYINGAFVHSINCFVPTMFSRVTLGFIATGEEPSTWHGEPDDWQKDYVATYVSGVRIEPYYLDQDNWWPSSDDNAVNVRFPAHPPGDKNLWQPLPYMVATQPKYAKGLAPSDNATTGDVTGQLPWATPYWGGDMVLYGWECGAMGMTPQTDKEVTSSQWDAWVLAQCGMTKNQLAAQRSRTAAARTGGAMSGPIPRDMTSASWAAWSMVKDNKCTSAQWYSCGNSVDGPPPPQCSFITPPDQPAGAALPCIRPDSEKWRRSQADSADLNVSAKSGYDAAAAIAHGGAAGLPFGSASRTTSYCTTVAQPKCNANGSDMKTICAPWVEKFYGSGGTWNSAYTQYTTKAGKVWDLTCKAQQGPHHVPLSGPGSGLCTVTPPHSAGPSHSTGPVTKGACTCSDMVKTFAYPELACAFFKPGQTGCTSNDACQSNADCEGNVVNAMGGIVGTKAGNGTPISTVYVDGNKTDPSMAYWATCVGGMCKYKNASNAPPNPSLIPTVCKGVTYKDPKCVASDSVV